MSVVSGKFKSYKDVLQTNTPSFSVPFKDTQVDFYEIIGMGAYGSVYRGLYNDKPVAIKIIPKEKIKDVTANEINILLFLTENKLCVEEIIKLYDFFEYEDKLYILMEYYSGEELRRKKLNINLWYDVAKHLISAVHCLHKNNIVHRDIKPQNILWNPEKKLRLIDFGFACSLNDPKFKCPLKAIGTPLYVSPELLMLKFSNEDLMAADIWAIGVTLYFLAYGKFPFDALKKEKLYAEILKSKPQYPPEIDDAQINLLKKLLEPNPIKRIEYFNQLDKKLKRITATIFK